MSQGLKYGSGILKTNDVNSRDLSERLTLRVFCKLGIEHFFMMRGVLTNFNREGFKLKLYPPERDDHLILPRDLFPSLTPSQTDALSIFLWAMGFVITGRVSYDVDKYVASQAVEIIPEFYCLYHCVCTCEGFSNYGGERHKSIYFSGVNLMEFDESKFTDSTHLVFNLSDRSDSMNEFHFSSPTLNLTVGFITSGDKKCIVDIDSSNLKRITCCSGGIVLAPKIMTNDLGSENEYYGTALRFIYGGIFSPSLEELNLTDMSAEELEQSMSCINETHREIKNLTSYNFLRGCIEFVNRADERGNYVNDLNLLDGQLRSICSSIRSFDKLWISEVSDWFYKGCVDRVKSIIHHRRDSKL
jgi:hypothetical protein